jgi:hypothetical protein
MNIIFEKFTLNGIEYNYAPFLGVSATVDGIHAGFTGCSPWGFTRLNKAQLESLIKTSQKILANHDISLNKREIIKRAIFTAEETLAKM